MSEHIYKVVELVGTSEASIEDAIQSAVSRATEISRIMRDAFYTDTPVWKRAVWALAEQAVRRALAAL